MPDTVFDEDTLAAASEAMGEEEERPLTFAELGVSWSAGPRACGR